MSCGTCCTRFGAEHWIGQSKGVFVLPVHNLQMNQDYWQIYFDHKPDGGAFRLFRDGSSMTYLQLQPISYSSTVPHPERDVISVLNQFFGKDPFWMGLPALKEVAGDDPGPAVPGVVSSASVVRLTQAAAILCGMKPSTELWKEYLELGMKTGAGKGYSFHFMPFGINMSAAFEAMVRDAMDRTPAKLIAARYLITLGDMMVVSMKWLRDTYGDYPVSLTGRFFSDKALKRYFSNILGANGCRLLAIA